LASAICQALENQLLLDLRLGSDMKEMPIRGDTIDLMKVALFLIDKYPQLG